MRKVISNTTPIISLLKIGKLDLLKDLYGSLIIPMAVFLEIEMGRDKRYYQDLSRLEWVKILNINNRKPLNYIKHLDLGEAEVIVLTREINSDLIIMDELLGRKQANSFGLNLTGTIGVLLKSKQLGLINSVGDNLRELVSKGTWINPKLMSKAIQLANEN